MKNVRAYSTGEGDGGRDRRLRPVSRVAPPRPHWGYLYGALVTVAATGTAAHFLARDQTLLHIADVVVGIASFGVFAVWVRINRMALTRLDEPDAGIERPRTRIVRSRKTVPVEDRTAARGSDANGHG